MIQESDLTNLSTNLDTEFKTAAELLDKIPVDPKQHDLTPLRDTLAELKKNSDVLLKFAAAAGAQAPGPVQLEHLDMPARRDAFAGANRPAVPPTVDPVIVPTTPPIGPPLEGAKTDPALPQSETQDKGAPGLPSL